MLNFVGLIGTNSKESNNRRLLQFMQKHFADKAAIELVEIDNIPLFNKPAKMKVPEVVSELARKLRPPTASSSQHQSTTTPFQRSYKTRLLGCPTASSLWSTSQS